MAVETLDKVVASKVEVLQVDDDASILEAAKLVLQDIDYALKVDTAHSVDEALTKLAKKQYDVIVSDYEMPLKNGLDFLKIIKEKTPNMPFILFTGRGREEVAIQALNLGANHYINKQGSPETVYGELAYSIRSAVAKNRAENALARSEVRFSTLIENAPYPIYINNIDGKLINANKAAEDLVCLNKNDFIGKSLLEIGLINEKSVAQAMKDISLAIEGKAAGPSEYEMTRADGKQITLELSTFPISIEGKQEFVGIANDITEKKQAQSELKESEQKFRKAFEASIDACYISMVDEGYFIDVNDAFFKTYGLTKDETVGKTALELGLYAHGPGDREKMVALIKENGFFTDLELMGRRKNGEAFPVLMSARLGDLQGKKVIFGVIRDISQERIREQAFVESEAKYRELVDALPEMVFELDINGNVVFANKKAIQCTGYSKEEFADGFNANRLVAPEDFERSERNLKKMFEGNMNHINEYLFVSKDGNRFPVSLSSTPVLKNGKIVGVRGLLVDITQRKKAEKRVAVVNEKLRVVGKLTRHDVKNKLSSIQANAYLLKKKIGNSPELTKYLHNIELDIESADRLFDLSSLFERIGAEEHIAVNVKDCFNEAVALFPNLKNINVINGSEGLTVTADSLLRQVFYNLIDNSLKHGKQVSQIELNYSILPSSALLVYSDNGVGISQDNKAKLFTEGFSTSNGTGLGLAMLRKILQVYGWSIVEEGESGKGAKFVITIPKTTINS